MNEYDVNFYSTADGAIALDIHSSSGASPYLRFKTQSDVREFFESIGMSNEKLKEVDAICTNLKKGQGFHEKMFLPDGVIDTVEQRNGHAG